MSIERLKNMVGLTEAARMSGLSVTRLRYLADVGRLPAVIDPVGRRLLDRSAVVQLAKEREGRLRRGDHEVGSG
jgi:predicted site-specific integrase-resolvase